jgi:hypothetical protein
MFFGKQPDPARVEAWNRTYLDHSRNPDDPSRCAIPDCLGRFPCAFRLEAAELLIVAGIDLPESPPPDDDNPQIPQPREPRSPSDPISSPPTTAPNGNVDPSALAMSE